MTPFSANLLAHLSMLEQVWFGRHDAGLMPKDE